MYEKIFGVMEEIMDKKLEEKLGAIEGRIDSLEKSIKALENKVDQNIDHLRESDTNREILAIWIKYLDHEVKKLMIQANATNMETIPH